MIVTKHFLHKIRRHNWRYFSGLNLWNQEITSEIKVKIENHWRDKIKVNTPVKESQNKYYVLSMFPYPSGFLHMGHVRVYTISDAIARHQRMKGKHVIHPIGWDAFGLPAENAAIERQIAPDKWTESNIAHMKSQLQILGCSFDWDREITTCDPSYYKWTQDLFLKLHDAGLIYQKEGVVNWDPVDQTVLADEQVDENGCSWRSGAKVEKKALKQWFVRTTRFAKDLLDGLDDSVLQDWRDIIKVQRHWIGDCTGVNFDFQITSTDNFITLWTSTPEFIKAAKFVVINDKHILATSEGSFLQKDIKKLKMQVINPLTQEEIPVFVSARIEFLPFTDAFLGIPGSCEQSTSFAQSIGLEHESLPLLTDEQRKIKQDQVCADAQMINKGGYWSSPKLRDWLISRQRFWGTPIPIIHCDKCGVQQVPRENLPVQLPKLQQLSQKGGCQLRELDSWIHTKCPKCQGAAKRETDTMDTFVDSSWYFLRYLDPQNTKVMFEPDKIKKIMPVDLYIGGKEHAVLHLYYARFISHFLYSLGLLPQREPFKRLLVQGMVMGRSYRVKGTGEYVTDSKIKNIDFKKNKAELISSGESVVVSWEKMSKSKHNGVDPDDMFREYGIDTTRLLILADVAPTSHRNWNSNTFPGIINWQKRLWLTVRDFIQHRSNPPAPIPIEEMKEHDDYMFDSRNYYLKGVTFNYCVSQQHSVAISKQQGLTNSLRRAPPAVFAYSPQFERALATQITLLAPMAPHFASELWSGFVSAPNRLNQLEEINWDSSVLQQKWPKLDDNYCLDLVVQVNSLEVDVVKIPKCQIAKLSKEEAISLAFKQAKTQTELGDLEVANTVYTVKEEYESVVNIKTVFVPGMIRKEKVKSGKKRSANIGSENSLHV